MVKNRKYDRRRAIDCKVVEKSRSHKGYCKYIVTIADHDGTITKHPVYGKDMQNALRRLMNQQKTNWIGARFNIWWVAVLWLVVMGIPTYLSQFDENGSPYIICSFLTAVTLFGLIQWWSSYTYRGE